MPLTMLPSFMVLVRLLSISVFVIPTSLGMYLAENLSSLGISNTNHKSTHISLGSNCQVSVRSHRFSHLSISITSSSSWLSFQSHFHEKKKNHFFRVITAWTWSRAGLWTVICGQQLGSLMGLVTGRCHLHTEQGSLLQNLYLKFGQNHGTLGKLTCPNHKC